jgi:hypothetical protein
MLSDMIEKLPLCIRCISDMDMHMIQVQKLSDAYLDLKLSNQELLEYNPKISKTCISLQDRYSLPIKIYNPPTSFVNFCHHTSKLLWHFLESKKHAFWNIYFVEKET